MVTVIFKLKKKESRESRNPGPDVESQRGIKNEDLALSKCPVQTMPRIKSRKLGMSEEPKGIVVILVG